MNAPRILVVALVALAIHSTVSAQLQWITSPINGHEYALTTRAMTWTQAEAVAQSEGGNLATVRSATENSWLFSTFGVTGGKRLWIGLNDVTIEGTFVWSSGEPVNFTAWANNQPDNYGGAQNFVYLWETPLGTWADEGANHHLAIIERATKLNWITNPSNGHDYALTSIMTWTQADALARKLGGNLATIRDQAENDWIDKTFGSAQSMWIGMNDLATEGTWVWANGEPVGFTNWCPGEPNNAGSGEDYGLLKPSSPTNTCGGAWFDGTNNLPPTFGLVEMNVSGTYTTYRQSCASSAGMPQLTSLNVPNIGATLQLQVTGLGPLKLGAILTGFNDQIWQAVPLPFDLVVIGAPGCMMNIDPVVNLTTWSDGAGRATPVIPIPNDPVHLGLTFFNQYVSMEAPPGRAMQITTTNAGKGVIGI